MASLPRLSKNDAGFTLIELLVVVSIIALLASIVFVGITTARERAQYTSVAAGLRQAEFAFQLWRNDLNCWPREGSSACGGVSIAANPTVASLIGNQNLALRTFLSGAPLWPFSAAEWRYDNDGDAWDLAACASSNPDAGVNLRMPGATAEQFLALNALLDGETSDSTAARNCGKVRYTGTDLLYVLSPVQ